MFKDAIDKNALAKKEGSELFYTRIKKGDLVLLERDREFDESLVKKFKKNYKKENEK